MLLSFSTKFVIQSEAKNLGNINVDVIEILPPFGRLNDNKCIYKYGKRKISEVCRHVGLSACV